MTEETRKESFERRDRPAGWGNAPYAGGSGGSSTPGAGTPGGARGAAPRQPEGGLYASAGLQTPPSDFDSPAPDAELDDPFGGQSPAALDDPFADFPSPGEFAAPSAAGPSAPSGMDFPPEEDALTHKDREVLGKVASAGQTMALDTASPQMREWTRALDALPSRMSVMMASFGGVKTPPQGFPAGLGASPSISVSGASVPVHTGEHEASDFMEGMEPGDLAGLSGADGANPNKGDMTALIDVDAKGGVSIPVKPTTKAPAAPPQQAKGVQELKQADFVLQKQIGSGGQGEVWRAWQTSLAREVAVKRLKAGDPGEFLLESYTSGALDHPNIVPVYDLGRMLDENGRETPLLAMKLVQGTPWDMMITHDRKKVGNLRTKIGRGELYAFLSKHLRILIDMCNAVMYAHSKGIIHRDLKPAQVMVGDFGEVFLMDWGLAVFTEERVPPTTPGGDTPKFRALNTAVNRCGSPAYMAPEQTHEIDRHASAYHTDVYLLGAIMYELAGRASAPRRQDGRGSLFHGDGQ
jgi:hypothetical protein